MFALPLPSLAEGEHLVSLDQSPSEQVVLGHLPDGLGQWWNLGFAPGQTDRCVMDHGPPDIAQDTYRHEPSGQRLSLV